MEEIGLSQTTVRLTNIKICSTNQKLKHSVLNKSLFFFSKIYLKQRSRMVLFKIERSGNQL